MILAFLSISEIARLNGHSIPAVSKAIRRLKINPSATIGKRPAFTPQDAEVLKASMRPPTKLK